jgi:hypothetical protein
MGRKVDKSRQTRRGALYRPVVSGWQQWQEAEGGGWVLAGEALELGELQPVEGAFIAVPVRRAFSLALWVPADDPALFADLVFTQLELRGLAGRTREATSFAWQEVAVENNEALLHAVILPAQLAPRYWHGDVVDYAVSPAFLPLAEDGVALWQEEGGWVAAVTRGGKLLHFQPLVEAEIGSSMALELWMMLAPLEAGHMLSGSVSVVVYYEGPEAPGLQDWRSGGGLPVEARALPPPVRPPKALDCLPLPVRDAQLAKTAGARRQRIALVAAAAYFLLVLVLAGNTLRLHWQASSLQASIGRDAAAVASTREAMERWNALNAAIDPTGYPLEVLYQTAQSLPAEGVRLTLFEMNLGRVIIQGEATTFTAAQRFIDDVKKSPGLSDFEWTAEQPRPLPNRSARFQIDGARQGYVPADLEGGFGAGTDG